MTASILRHTGLLLAVLLLSHGTLHAQVGTHGLPALGMAGGGPAFVHDNDALFLNPANLLYPGQRGRGVLTLGQTQAFTGGSLYQFNHYNATFTGGQQLTGHDVTATLDAWFGADRRRAGVFAEAVPLAFSYRLPRRAFGLAVRARTYSQAGLNRGLFDLVLRGTEESREIPLDLEFGHLSTVDVSVAYSQALLGGRLTVGVAPKIVFGLEYMQAEMTSTVVVEDDALAHRFAYTARAAGGVSGGLVAGFSLFQSDPMANVEISPFSGIAGQGFGVDLGATFALRNDVLVAASLTDLGQIAWRQDAQTVTPLGSEFRFDGLTFDRDRLRDEYDNSVGAYLEAQLDSLAREAYAGVARDLSGFTSALPAAAHVGGTWFITRKATLAAGSSVALNRAPGSLSHQPSFYAGAEYRLGGRVALPLRTGLRMGGEGALTVGFGLGLETPVYDFGLSVAATPKTDVLGAGGRYMVALSVGTFRF